MHFPLKKNTHMAICFKVIAPYLLPKSHACKNPRSRSIFQQKEEEFKKMGSGKMFLHHANALLIYICSKVFYMLSNLVE